MLSSSHDQDLSTRSEMPARELPQQNTLIDVLLLIVLWLLTTTIQLL